MPKKAGLQNTERPIKCKLGHVTSPNSLIMPCHQYLDTDQVSSLSEK